MKMRDKLSTAAGLFGILAIGGLVVRDEMSHETTPFGRRVQAVMRSSDMDSFALDPVENKAGQYHAGFDGLGAIFHQGSDGTVLEEVIHGSPIDGSGLQVGDHITHVNDQAITREKRLNDLVRETQGSIQLTVDNFLASPHTISVEKGPVTMTDCAQCHKEHR